jgi:hypothetical protein
VKPQNPLESITEDHEGNSSATISENGSFVEDEGQNKMAMDSGKGAPQSKAVNKVTITFNKPKNSNEYSGSNSELNVSLTKKTNTKIPPGGGAGPSTLILKDLNNPQKQTFSKRSFKEADFQNPPSFLKGDPSSFKYGAAEGKHGLPQLKGKNIQAMQAAQNTQSVQSTSNSNAPKVNRLVALPQITETKTGSEKLYLKNGTLQKQEAPLDNSFEYKPYGQAAANSSVDENVNPSLFATSTQGNKLAGKQSKKGEIKSTMFPSIAVVPARSNQNVRKIVKI